MGRTHLTQAVLEGERIASENLKNQQVQVLQNEIYSEELQNQAQTQGYINSQDPNNQPDLENQNVDTGSNNENENEDDSCYSCFCGGLISLFCSE